MKTKPTTDKRMPNRKKGISYTSAVSEEASLGFFFFLCCSTSLGPTDESHRLAIFHVNHRITKVAEFLSASFVRLGGKGPSLAGNSGASTTIAELDDVQQQQQQQVGTEGRGWDKEMEDKVQGWETEWDQDKQRFYYVNAETLETSYTAPFKISVSVAWDTAACRQDNRS